MVVLKLRKTQQNYVSDNKTRKFHSTETKNEKFWRKKIQQNARYEYSATRFSLYSLFNNPTHTPTDTHSTTNTTPHHATRRAATIYTAQSRKNFEKKKNEKRKKMFSTRSTPHTHNCATLSPVEQ